MTPPRPTYSGELPIHGRREAILNAVRENPVVVVAGETGSGKTTQIPKILLDAGLGADRRIGCTQPRRVAALAAARRLAEELGVPFGREVGAKIRFTDETRRETAVKVMTDGILLTAIQDDPGLSAYEAIVIDEAHERSLNIDFILGCLRRVLERREDLKVVITSATIDTARFAEAFGGAPVLEVSGRMFPVETVYRPPEAWAEAGEEPTTPEAAEAAVAEILRANRPGDILVFLPGERDIRELRKTLEDGPAGGCDVLPLFGRMGNAEQERIFHPGGRRRVILATNIAETSLTVPGIRFVVDSGLARISRYSPQSRTQRLPVEPISRASAEQRKGRCGRVAEGVCYRLYSERDFHSRPAFTTPEIHRSNLASVILRMLAFRLGDIRRFPFIDPPPENAIRGGFRLLAELGAVDDGADAPAPEAPPRLTPLGKRLARLPVDPTVGRMLLQAAREDALPEVLVIAAGLSIRDPRERPSEAPAEADAAHARFAHPESDFLTLLNIWNAYHTELDRLSQGQLRKFCKAHYLAYLRMREWRDIHQQLRRSLDALKPEGGGRGPGEPAGTGRTDAAYRAIHRSILCGLLGNVARKEEGHRYIGARNRKALLFPGSALFDRKADKQRRQNTGGRKKEKASATTSSPEWLVCGEWMETSRLFARTAARIEPEWIEELAGGLLSIRHSETFWSERAAAARCRRRVLLFGLELRRESVSATAVHPEAATDLFARSGLVEEGIRERPPFLEHNAEVRRHAESESARLGLGSSLAVEDRLFHFYRDRLEAVGSYPELRRFAKERHGGSLDFLRAEAADLLPPTDTPEATEAFPRTATVGGSTFPLTYRNQPGDEADGVTLHVPLPLLPAIRRSTLDWLVPGHLRQLVEPLLRSLPKALRVQLHPLKERADECALALRPAEESLESALAAYLWQHHGVRVRPDAFSRASVPPSVLPRIQVEDTEGNALAAGRDPDALREELEARVGTAAETGGMAAIPAWQAAAQRHERESLEDWDFGDRPHVIDLSGETALPLRAYPALVAEGGAVHLRLLRDAEHARRSTAEAWPLLAEKAMGRDIAWVWRDLRALRQLGPPLLQLGGAEAVESAARDLLRRYLFRVEAPLPLREANFRATLERARNEAKGLVPVFRDRLEALLEARSAVERILEAKQTKTAVSYPGMRAHLDRVAPPDLLRDREFGELEAVTRFLRGMRVRAERARENVRRDMAKAERVAPYEARLEQLREATGIAPWAYPLKHYTRMLEEFKVSVFAQELGTAMKASEKRLDTLAAALEAGEPPNPEPGG